MRSRRTLLSLATVNTVVTNILSILGTALDSDGSGNGTTDPSLQSNILGTVNSIKVKKDISNVFLNIAGNLKSLTLGGSLIGGATANSGEIFTVGDSADERHRQRRHQDFSGYRLRRDHPRDRREPDIRSHPGTARPGGEPRGAFPRRRLNARDG